MIKKKKYRIVDFVTLVIKIIPIQSLCSIVYVFLYSSIPAFQAMVTGGFINIAIDIFNGNNKYSAIYLSIILIICCESLYNLIPVLQQMIELSGKNRLKLILRKEIVDKRSCLDYYHVENNDTCELINRVCKEVDSRFMKGFNSILKGIGLIIRVTSLLFIVMSSTLFGGILILLVCAPLLRFAVMLGKKNYNLEKDAQRIKRKYSYLAEVLTNREYAEERKLFSFSSSITEQYNKLFDKAYNLESNIEKKRYINMKSGSMVTIVIGLIIMIILLPSVNNGQMTVGIYIALVSAILSLVQSMSWQLAGVMHEAAKLKEYLHEFSVFVCLSEKESACDLPVEIKDFIFDSLEFRNVTFKYPGTEKYVLKNCSFILYRHKSYSFVGTNGAGKTTITKLITGMYDEYDGDILINGKNIEKYSYSELKSLIGVVFQDYAKYALTVGDNVQLGNIQKNDTEAIQKVLIETGLDEAVNKLEYGLDTSLGKIEKNSVDLSGGQWQKLALARLLFSDSKINILDEPTASLDPMAESRIYDMFHRIKEDRFTIYITHRLGAAKIADEILVLDKGYIIEQGSHDMLMTIKNGLYRQMFEGQKLWYELDNST